VVASPVLAGGRLIVADAGGTVYAFDATSGSECWRYTHRAIDEELEAEFDDVGSDDDGDWRGTGFAASRSDTAVAQRPARRLRGLAAGQPGPRRGWQHGLRLPPVCRRPRLAGAALVRARDRGRIPGVRCGRGLRGCLQRTVQAFDAATGEPRWTVETGQEIISSYDYFDNADDGAYYEEEHGLAVLPGDGMIFVRTGAGVVALR
jgi:outer membrane protein assembly factor BamB